MVKKQEPSGRREMEEQFSVVVAMEVRWGDMDAYQHVNNTQYFQYFEQARIAYFNKTLESKRSHAGLPEGVGAILHSTSCRFRAPVTYPDILHVGARVVDVGKDRFKMEFAVYSEQLSRIAAEGEAIVVSYDYSEGRKVDLPDAWTRSIEAIESSGQVSD